MDHSNQNNMHTLKEKAVTVRDWVMDHSKIVMPLVLVVCVLITIVIAVNANHRDALEKEAEQAAMSVSTDDLSVPAESLEPVEFELEKNAHPEVNNLVRVYYDAQVSGDVETISKLNTYLDEIEIIKVQEMSKYVDSYPVLDVYTKPGLTENSYVAYVCSEVKFSEVEQELPGMQTFYIGMNENGDYFINDGTNDADIQNYITEITLQDDVVDLNNKVVVEYNELLAEDQELEEYIAYLREKINEDVGEILAKAEQPEEPVNDVESSQTETDEQSQTVKKTVRATDVVNIRSSDSEEADRIDKAQIGQEFTLLEERGNGWSKVSHNGKEAFIKSDYLEVVEEEPIEIVEATPEEQETPSETETTTSNETASGTVKVKESVKVRKSASTSSDSLGTVYAGDELELLMKQADGWTKVKYKGQTAFVKSDYVE